MLIDTGSAVTLISKEIFDLVGFSEHQLEKVTNELKTADGEPLQVYGKTEVELSLENKSFITPVIVAELGGLSGILGLDFLSKNEVLFDVGKGILIFSDFKVKLESEHSLGCARVYLADDITISGQSEKFVEGSIGNSKFMSSEGVVEPNTGGDLNQGILIPKSIVNIREGKFVFSILNTNSESIELKKNTPVATIQGFSNFVECDFNGNKMTKVDTNEIQTSEVPDHLKVMLENISTELTVDEKNKLASVLYRYIDVFESSDGKFGRTSKVTHTIDTGNNKPIKLPFSSARNS
ncbi:uncharacterized protein LOC134235836 [Saccostrea cucullata]|uniref:uncharacterized protein LOC134235836 n=1 Tax=Saccostrea cuccullata TaxID=36930 RepID=UPI002ED03027